MVIDCNQLKMKSFKDGTLTINLSNSISLNKMPVKLNQIGSVIGEKKLQQVVGEFRRDSENEDELTTNCRQLTLKILDV